MARAAKSKAKEPKEKPAAEEREVAQPLYKAACRFTGGGWRKNGGALGVKIPVGLCRSKVRDDLFVSSSLRVRLSQDPTTDQPQIPGLGDEYRSVELTVKVNTYSASDADITFSMSFDSKEMDAEFLKSISHSAGSIYVLKATADEDAAADEEDDEADNELGLFHDEEQETE